MEQTNPKDRTEEMQRKAEELQRKLAEAQANKERKLQYLQRKMQARLAKVDLITPVRTCTRTRPLAHALTRPMAAVVAQKEIREGHERDAYVQHSRDRHLNQPRGISHRRSSSVGLSKRAPAERSISSGADLGDGDSAMDESDMDSNASSVAGGSIMAPLTPGGLAAAPADPEERLGYESTDMAPPPPPPPAGDAPAGGDAQDERDTTELLDPDD